LLKSLPCRSVASGANAALVRAGNARLDEVGGWHREIEQATGSPLRREPKTAVPTDEPGARAGDAPALWDLSEGVASLGREGESVSDYQPDHRLEDWDPSEDRRLPTRMRACADWVRSQARSMGEAHPRA
jgi:hypothetical protein